MGLTAFEQAVERLTPETAKLIIVSPPSQGEIVDDGEIAITGDFDLEETYRLYLTDANGLTYVLEAVVSESGNTLSFDTSSGLDDHNHTIPAGEMLGKIAAGAFYTPTASFSFPITIHRYLNIHNGLHSPVLATDMSGAVIWRRAYEPFGAELTDSAITLNNASLSLTFLSREYDSDLGLYQLGARWYDPKLGRFISTDPIPSSLNQYAYAGNNPYRYSDRDGKQLGFAGLMIYAAAVVGTGVPYAIFEADVYLREGTPNAMSAEEKLKARYAFAEAYKWAHFPGDICFTLDLAYQLPRGIFRGAKYLAGRLAKSSGEAAEAAESIGLNRLPQDVNVNPKPPDPLGLDRPISKSAAQNAQVQKDIQAAKDLNAWDIRVNQQQVNAWGQRVGINRPDLQYTLNYIRYYHEYDSSVASSLYHRARLLANDPFARVILHIIQ